MFNRPSFQQLIDRTESDFKASLGLTTVLRRSVTSALSRVIAATSHNLHSHLDYIARQLFPDQADAINLERHASIYGFARREAVFAEFTADCVFTSVATLPAGAILKRSDNTEFIVSESVTSASAETLSVEIEATEAGSLFNTSSGSVLTLESPISGIENELTITLTIIEGSDVEDDESLRSRLIARIQAPPSGGTIDDYKSWAFEVADVGRVWVLTDHTETYAVGVTAVTTSGDATSVAKTDEIRANIDAQKPVTAKTVVFSPIEQPVDLEISITPNTLEVRTEVEAELRDLFTREAQVRGAYAGVGQPVYAGSIALSKISEAVSIAAGEDDHVITSPATAPAPGEVGTLLKLGTITFATLV